MVMPKFPASSHVFEKMSLNICVDDKSFDLSSKHWRNHSAPYRNMTARDAISDLPACNKGQNVQLVEPMSWFQRMMRYCPKNGAMLSQVSHHEEKSFSEIIMARINHIPKTLGADWRDLPNKTVLLPSGKKANKLKYPYIDIKTKKRAVCYCSVSKDGKCRVMDRQENTLIPYSLVHRAGSHNRWKNCYGRTHWDTYFSTVTTNVHPDGKQGRVLHPEQNRILSVREYARSQGFPDSSEFFGSILEKYKQIGNAVPPPMAKALGISILCAQVERQNSD